MQCDAMQCNAMQCNAMQCNAIQYNTMQCNAMQCNLGDLEIWENRAQGSGEPGWKFQMNWTHRWMLQGRRALEEPGPNESRHNSPGVLEVLKNPL